VGAVAIIAITARRPIFGCALLAVGVPMTTALGRDTVIPILRPNEAILLLVLAGLALHYLLTRPSASFIGLDLAIAGFAVGTSLIPWLVLFLSRADMDFVTWRAVLGPLQFLAVYLCFAQLRASDDHLKWLLQLTLLTSVIVGVIAVLELQDFPPGIRALVSTYFPPDNPLLDSTLSADYRPTSLLGVYGAVGAFAMLNVMLALTLAKKKDTRINGVWLTTVLVVNLGSLAASLTWAPAVALVLGTAIVIWYSRYVPRLMWVSIAAGVVALAILWPFVSARIDASAISLGSIQNIDARIRNWQYYFLPVLAEHIWFGTGTVIPSELPPYLSDFVDNEYLRIGFRAGLVGIGLLMLMLSSVGVFAWRCRDSTDPWLRRLGAVSLATVVTILLVGFTAEYLSFGGLSQYIAMLFGLLAARIRHPAQFSKLFGSRLDGHALSVGANDSGYRLPESSPVTGGSVQRGR
jgi:hypothetical protein